MKKYILVICFLFFKIHAEQFIYPVADFDHGNQFMVLYQKSLREVELWIWNASNQHALKGLSSFLTPANLRMMPSGKGFSFIDKGFIKIKEFAKRSPKTLPIYEPIGLFSSMNWIDDETFYFVAREGDFFQIFQGNLQAKIQRLTNQPTDALYPQKIGSTLFYMKRDMDCQISIVAQPWNPLKMNQLKKSSKITTLVPESYQQLCFLHMISDREGFYLQAPHKKIEDDNLCYEFSCHHLKQNEDQWENEKLFSIQIPSKYVTGSSRLYESLEPFLPNYTHEGIVYFTSWNYESTEFELYKFDISNKNLEKISEQFLYKNNNQQIFSPYLHGNKICCGFIIKDQKSIQNLFDADDVYLELPYFDTKE